MDTISGPEMVTFISKIGGLGILHRYLTLDQYKDYWIFRQFTSETNYPFAFSVGSIYHDKERIDWCIDNQVHGVCIDIAHGDSIHMYKTLDYLMDKDFRGFIIAGNVVTPEATRALLEHGADLVKVGVGPGSVCTTRVKTGCGFPQLSAIENCAQAGPVIGDGGIKQPGDAAKALAAGATAVMIGGMFAGSDQVPGWKEAMADTEPYRNPVTGETSTPVKYISFRGMASKEARKGFGQQPTNAEGVSRSVLCQPAGSTQAILDNIDEGIRSAMSYTGADTLRNFVERSGFVRVTSAAQIENHPHFKG
jgi:IMP dehydrogenase